MLASNTHASLVSETRQPTCNVFHVNKHCHRGYLKIKHALCLVRVSFMLYITFYSNLMLLNYNKNENKIRVVAPYTFNLNKWNIDSAKFNTLPWRWFCREWIQFYLIPSAKSGSFIKTTGRKCATFGWGIWQNIIFYKQFCQDLSIPFISYNSCVN